jgi:exosortase/archaeosortase family protein
MKTFAKYKFFLIYLLKFIGAFCIIFYGTEAVIGISAPGKYYSPFIHNYLDYISWLRASLLHGAEALLTLSGYPAYFTSQYQLRIDGAGVKIVYSCLGYGIMSFWLALIFANKGKFTKKLLWMTGGLVCIWLINIARISMMLLVTRGHSQMPLGIDHHTWFNIASYILIFILMYFFDRSQKTPAVSTPSYTEEKNKKQWT